MMNDNPTRRHVLAGAAGTFSMLSVGTATAQKTSQYIVGIDPSTTQSSTTAQAAQNAVTAQADAVRHVLDFEGQGTVVAGRFSSQALDALRQRSDVRYVEPDATGHMIVVCYLLRQPALGRSARTVFAILPNTQRWLRWVLPPTTTGWQAFLQLVLRLISPHPDGTSAQQPSVASTISHMARQWRVHTLLGPSDY